MTVAPTFPLFKLPFLALRNVISCMYSVDQMWLSMISKKTNNLVNGKQKFDLKVINNDYNRNDQILCKNQNGSDFMTIEIVDLRRNCIDKNALFRKIDRLLIPVKQESNVLTTFWKDEIEGYQKMTSVLCNVFNIKTFSISFYLGERTKYSKIVEYVQKMKSELKIDISKIKMRDLTLDKTICRTFLENFRDVPELIIQSSYLNYRHNNIQSNTRSGYCFTKYAEWITLNNMNLLNQCEKISLWHLTWSSQEMNQFLKEWMNTSTMGDMELVVERVDIQKAVDNLPVTSHNKVVVFNERQLQLNECFEIHRNDGVKANIFSYRTRMLIMQTYI